MTIIRGILAGGIVGGLLGMGLGVLYSVGGFFVDLFTTGLNWGTLMAFGALIGMPVIFGGVGAAIGGVIAGVWSAARWLTGDGT